MKEMSADHDFLKLRHTTPLSHLKNNESLNKQTHTHTPLNIGADNTCDTMFNTCEE